MYLARGGCVFNPTRMTWTRSGPGPGPPPMFSVAVEFLLTIKLRNLSIAAIVQQPFFK